MTALSWRFTELSARFATRRGNFELVHHESKKNPASEKILNFDTLKCGNCGNFIMVFWPVLDAGSAKPRGSELGRRIHNGQKCHSTRVAAPQGQGSEPQTRDRRSRTTRNSS